MIGLSRTSGARMRAMGMSLRSSRSASAVIVSAPVTMPAGRNAFILFGDAPASMQTNPLSEITVSAEISTDGGTNWQHFCGFFFRGEINRVSQVGYPTISWSVSPPPPAGCLVRTRTTCGLAPIEAGWSMRSK